MLRFEVCSSGPSTVNLAPHGSALDKFLDLLLLPMYFTIVSKTYIAQGGGLWESGAGQIDRPRVE